MSAAHDFADSLATLEDVAGEANAYIGVILATDGTASPAWVDRLEAIARCLEDIANELAAAG
ncbi:hypothetical protein [Nocardia sp. NPDC059239]|uniref:hypothetical protein n=1 Tax=unclassified Nocardia TaxID=2637762 RepID=UPI0036A58F55